MISERYMAKRFWTKVMVEANGCFTWQGGVTGDGYGIWNPPRSTGVRQGPAHRIAYRVMRGEIPEGLVLDHPCRNRACVNPDHLEPVTQKENVRRGWADRVGVKAQQCSHGHDLTDDKNLYVRPNGYTDCRTCRREASRRSYLRKIAR